MNGGEYKFQLAFWGILDLNLNVENMKKLLLLVPLLLSCGVGRSAEYSKEIKENFLSACIPAANKNLSKNQAITYCQCTWEDISKTIPIEDFVKLERGEAMSPNSNSTLKKLVTKCGGRANDLQLQNQ